MTVISPEPRSRAGAADTAASKRTPRGQVPRFLRAATPFCIGLAVVVGAAEMFLRLRNDLQDGRKLIGREVYVAKQAARRPGPGVTTLYLGDSVARQLFRPGTEPGADVRYVTSNYAISLAGQFYLLEEALNHCPDVRVVNLLLVPHTWGNDLGPPFTDDYFCGHFHGARQIADVWRLKKDVRLTTVHASRWLLPNLLAENAARRPQGPVDAPAQGHPVEGWLAPAGGEPLLRVVDALVPPPATASVAARVAPDGVIDLPLSSVSRHYLARIGALCQSRGVTLRVLPGPVPDTRRYRDPHAVYDRDVLHVDAAKFLDETHVRPEHLSEVRAEVIAAYGLDRGNAP